MTIFTLLMMTYLCYNVLLKAKYFLCYCKLLTVALFEGKGGSKQFIFSEKNSIILLNLSCCLLCCKLRFQCHCRA